MNKIIKFIKNDYIKVRASVSYILKRDKEVSHLFMFVYYILMLPVIIIFTPFAIGFYVYSKYQMWRFYRD